MNRVALITGVAGGIGSATAQLFVENGWDVVGVDRRQVDYLPRDIHFILGDIAEPAALEYIFKEVTAKKKHLDVLINNAAIQICKPLINTEPEEWDAVMASNLRSVYLAIRLAYPLMKNHGGSIVNVSSVHAIATSANIAAYAASKGALLALTRALAIELAPDKIRVNAILPGAVDTPMLRSGLARGHLQGKDVRELIQNLAKRTVIGRVGQPNEIAQAILFLSDNDRSSFMTGQALVIDGGATTKLSTE